MEVLPPAVRPPIQGVSRILEDPPPLVDFSPEVFSGRLREVRRVRSSPPRPTSSRRESTEEIVERAVTAAIQPS